MTPGARAAGVASATGGPAWASNGTMVGRTATRRRRARGLSLPASAGSRRYPRGPARAAVDLVPDLSSTRAGALAELRRQIGGDDPVGACRARRGDLLRQRADPALEVGEGARHLGGPAAGEHDVARAADSLTNRSTAISRSTRPRAPARRDRGRGSRTAGRHRAAQVVMRPSAAASRMPRCVEATFGRHLSRHARRTQSGPPSPSATRPGKQTRAQDPCRARRARCRGAAPTGSAPRRQTRSIAGRHGGGRLGRGADDRRVTGGRQHAQCGARRRACPDDVAVGSSRGDAATRRERRLSPGPDRSDAAASGVSESRSTGRAR